MKGGRNGCRPRVIRRQQPSPRSAFGLALKGALPLDPIDQNEGEDTIPRFAEKEGITFESVKLEDKGYWELYLKK